MSLICTSSTPLLPQVQPPNDRSTGDHLDIGEAKKLTTITATGAWTSSDDSIAKVYGEGWVVALKLGDATIARNGKLVAKIQVIDSADKVIQPATLKQFPDNRVFTVNGRKCVGTELNGKMEGKSLDNRVTNPTPIDPKQLLEWELAAQTPVVDGAGVLMGMAAPESIGGRSVPCTKINHGMSKVIEGKLWVYAFGIRIKVDPKVASVMDSVAMKSGTTSTSSWVPLDCVVDNSALLDIDGIGEGKLPRLPLDTRRYRITGGDDRQYILPDGEEVSIVPHVEKEGPVPSHYLRRPSGTVNVIYSVPGFDLGGQGLDSFLINGKATFRPAKGAKIFVMPTFYPYNSPKKGEKTEKTMTFLYGAVEVPGSETVFGWVAKEALAPTR